MEGIRLLTLGVIKEYMKMVSYLSFVRMTHRLNKFTVPSLETLTC